MSRYEFDCEYDCMCECEQKCMTLSVSSIHRNLKNLENMIF